jgi:hypothetical protein
MFLTKVKPNWRCIHLLKGAPFIHFELATFGIQHQIPYDFMQSYNDMPPDNYQGAMDTRIDRVDGIAFANGITFTNGIDFNDKVDCTTRSRRYAKLTVDVRDNYEYSIADTQSTVFEQNVEDSRSVKRVFEPIVGFHLCQPWLLEFVTQITALSVLNHNYCKGDKPIKSVDVHLHQVRQTSYLNMDSHNSPEGIHRDGADYIVSALVVNRHNVEGGESIIYNKQTEPVYKTILDTKEGLYQEDIEQLHYVTPISTHNEGIGFRDIVGLDIMLNT